MAATTEDLQVRHSLWLQKRSGRPSARQPLWRSDWTPVGLIVLLLVFLILLSVFLPANETVERVKQAAQDDNKGSIQHPPVVGILAEP